MNDAALTPDEAARLRAPFPPGFIKQYTSGKTVFRYITARDVMDRLDDVVGPSDWSTDYRLMDAESFAVECRLTVRGITRADVGYPNNPELPEEKEREKLKAAYSDALKRAAVHFGIGRFLYGPSSIGQSATEGERAPARPSHLLDEAQKLGAQVVASAEQISALQDALRSRWQLSDPAIDGECERLYNTRLAGLTSAQATDWLRKIGRSK